MSKKKTDNKVKPCLLIINQGDEVSLLCPYGASQARMLMALIESNTTSDIDMWIEEDI